MGFAAQDFHKGGTLPSHCLPSECTYSQFAAGARASLNLNEHLAVDSSVMVTPGKSPYDSGSGEFIEGGRGTELLLGARGFVRTRRWGLFADAEPGVLSWSHVILGMALSGTPQLPVLTYGRRNSLVIDLGGGVEYAPQNRVRVRIGVGDLLVRSNDLWTVTSPPPNATAHSFATYPWLNELRANGEVSWQLGKPIFWTPPDTHQPQVHNFFDKANLAILAISLLGQASDAITTQRFLHHGDIEEDPLARPFVDSGWPGEVGFVIVENAGQLSVMYALHRMHRHRLERTVPLAFAADGAIAAYRNRSLLADHHPK